MSTLRRGSVALAVTTVALLGTAACSSSTDTATTAGSGGSASTAPMPSDSAMPSDGAMPSDSAMPSTGMAGDMVGSGCAAYAKAVPAGAGSVSGMAQDPVATAASNNPLLKTLTAAVSGKVNPKVDLVDTLNGGEFTVFAPIDTAFAKIPAATLKTLGTAAGAKTLTSVLTYHVVPGQLAPSAIDGSHKTVEGSAVEVTGSGDNLRVNGNAKVICGGVMTANATVYLIDSVLMPPKM